MQQLLASILDGSKTLANTCVTLRSSVKGSKHRQHLVVITWSDNFLTLFTVQSDMKKCFSWIL